MNYRYLTTAEKDDRLERLHNLQRQTKRKADRLSAKIAENIEHKGVIVDEAMHHDPTQIVNDHTSKVNATYPNDCFQKLFWMQQQKASALTNARSMRWYPLMIKWCLYLRHLSGSAYEMLRESGCITLPSQRTLRDYTHYVRSTTGFSAEVDEQLMEAAKVAKAEEWEKCVVLVMDEMHVKEDLVYDKHSGALIGFVNLGQTNQHLLQFQKAIEGDNTVRNLQKQCLHSWFVASSLVLSFRTHSFLAQMFLESYYLTPSGMLYTALREMASRFWLQQRMVLQLTVDLSSSTAARVERWFTRW